MGGGMFTRIAIYHVPAGGLGAFGARWLGWDIARGHVSAQTGDLYPAQAEVTARPRRYGLHATIKPPFRLAGGASFAALSQAMEKLCAQLEPVTLSGLEITRMGRFLALFPKGGVDGLNALAARVVVDLDEFRAPLSAAELDRRRKGRLSPSKASNLLRWGYPHVMQDFRFHITLTGPLDDETAGRVYTSLRSHLSELMSGPYPVDSLSLVGEDDQGHFHEIERYPLASVP